MARSLGKLAANLGANCGANLGANCGANLAANLRASFAQLEAWISSARAAVFRRRVRARFPQPICATGAFQLLRRFSAPEA
jgi:hypothetical protein